MRKRSLGILALALVGLVVTAAPADALTRSCTSATRMCVCYHSIGYGLGAEFGSDVNVSSFNSSITTNDIYFKAGPYGSAGAGSWVWNNAAALRNTNISLRATMFVNSNCTGPFDRGAGPGLINLALTKNDNASLCWTLP